MRPDRPCSAVRRTVLASLWAVVLLAVPVRGDDRVVVPGGTETLRRVLDLSSRPDGRFVVNLNLKLLEVLRADGDWEKIESRRVLDRTVGTLADLAVAVPEPTELSLDTAAERRALGHLAPRLGYELSGRGSETRLVASRKPDSAWVRRVVSALGVPVAGLRPGRTAWFRIPQDGAPLALSLDVLSRAAGRQLSPDRFLRELARDQELGFLLASHRRLATTSWQQLLAARERGDLRDRAARLYRYGWSVQRLAEGRLVVPGGPQAWPLWLEVARLEADAPDFEQRWLVDDGGRRAHLWHALMPIGDATASAWLENLRDAGGLDEFRPALRLGFSAPRGADDGLEAVVRSLPTDAAGEPKLPGQTRYWAAGLAGSEPPKEAADLTKITRTAASTDPTVVRVALDALAAPEGEGAPARLRIAAGWLRDRPELATPEVVVAMARGAGRFETGLSALTEVDPAHPETVRLYLLTVAHLDSLSPSVETELLAQNFQAVVEWMRGFARRRSVHRETLETLFQEWSRIHAEARGPSDVEGEVLDFLGQAIAAIPSPPADFPGRGPLERTLLWAWTGDDGSTFEWEGLEYAESRSRDLAGRVATRLEEAELPSLDDFARLKKELEEVLEACRLERVEVAVPLATRALRTVRQYPSLDVPTGGLDPRHSLATETWKRNVQSTLIEIARVEHPSLLSPLRTRLREEVALSAPLRTALLAPLFAAGLGNQERMVFQTRDLVLTHELFFGHRASMLASNMWQPAKRVQSREERHGSVIRGHLGSLPTALAAATLSIAAGADTGLPTESWYSALVAEPWPRVSPAVLDLVAELEAAGGEILSSAVSALEGGGDASSVYEVTRRIPLARLERAASDGDLEATVSERLMLGLAAVEPDGFGAPEALPLTPERRRRIGALRDALGPDWRSELDRLGVPTPRVNGRFRPWIGTWPPYEALEQEFSTRALHERMLIDLRLTVAAFLAQADLPSVAGADITWKLFFDRPTDLRLETANDWESFTHWLRSLGSDPWRDVFRECLSDGYYRLRPF